MLKEYGNSFREWCVQVPQRWWDMLSVPLTFVPLLIGIVSLILWAIKNKLPLPFWQLILIGIGAILFFILSFLAFHRVRLERDKAKGLTPLTEYAGKILVDSKAPRILEITNTLQSIADYQGRILNEKLMVRRLKLRKIADIQKALQEKLTIPVGNPHLGNQEKINTITRQMKRLGLLNESLNEDQIRFMVEIAWVLDDKGVGIPQYLDSEEYNGFKSKLNNQTQNVSGDKSEEMILVYQDLTLGLNSLIAYTHYIPRDKLKVMPYNIMKTIPQMRHERDQILKTYMQKISKELEGELKQL